MDKHSTLFVLLLVTVGGLLTLSLSFAPEAPRGPSSAEEREDGATTLRYDVLYQSRQRARFDGSSDSTAAMHFDGQLHVTTWNARSLSFAFGQVDRASFTFDGEEIVREVAPDSLLVRLDGDGRVVEFHSTSASPTLTDHLLRIMALEWMRGGAREVVEATPHGQARTTYALVGQELTRTRVSYEALDGVSEGSRSVTVATHVGVFDGAVLSSLEGSEELAANDDEGHEVLAIEASIEASLVGVAEAPTDRPSHSAGIAMRPDDEPLRVAHLQAAARGLDGVALMNTMALHANGGRAPNHERFLWQAVARLQLEPELCHELEALFRDESTSLAGRALTLDLLTHAGTPEAQTSLVSLLGDERVVGHEAEPQLLQRLTFVEGPTEETLAFLAERFDSAEGHVRSAALYSMGAAARHADATGGSSDALVARIRERVSEHADPAAITALGVAGRREDAALVASFTESEETSTRRTSAQALGHMPAGAGRESLEALLADSAPEVRTDALRSLARQGFDGSHLELVRHEIADGALGEASIDAVWRELSALSAEHPERVAAVLRALLARGIERAPLRTRVYGLLRQLEA